MQVRVTQSLMTWNSNTEVTKVLIAEKVVETQEIFSMSQSSDSLGLWTHCYEFDEGTNLLMRKMNMHAKVYTQFQIHKYPQISRP